MSAEETLAYERDLNEQVGHLGIIRAAAAFYKVHTYIQELENQPRMQFSPNYMRDRAFRLGVKAIHDKMHEMVPKDKDEA